jgi:PEP-CTERM motif
MNAKSLIKSDLHASGIQARVGRHSAGKLLLPAMLLASLSIAPAQSTLIYDSFTYTGILNGHTPDTTVGGASWVAAGAIPNTPTDSSGSDITVSTAQSQTETVNLGASYFANNPGIYTLSCDMLYPSGTASSSTWISLGFVANPVVTGTMSPPDGASPWLLYRASGEVRVFGGKGTANSLIGAGALSEPIGSTYTMKLVLDTAAANWTLDAYIGSTQLDLNGAAAGDTYVYASNPSDIASVGFGASPASPNAVATVDNFTLTVTSVPEPSTAALFLLGGGLFVGITRKRMAALG